ncbi:MAG: WbqC family protein [Prevotella sp.]|nr:WbqC family protein [Prevotella sp.]
MINGKRYIAFTQPYFFPYIGYWQLIHAADLFLIGDNVHYIKHHWINRNRILGEGGQPQYFGIEVSHASCNRLICETKRVVSRKQAEYLCRVLRFYYGRAPHYNEAMEVIRPILLDEEPDLTQFLLKHMRAVAEYIGIKTEIRLLSEVTARWDCKAPELIRRTCEHFGYTNFINSINGTKYYTKEAFREMGINLHFLRRDDDIRYKQRSDEFVPDLSIIDVMMYCSRDEIHDMLDRYHFE